MNCWKTINFSKQYGTERLFILSSLTTLFTFILLYVPLSYLFVPEKFNNSHFIFLLTGIILMYPFHKLLHYLPIAHLGKKVKKQVEFKYGFYPLIYIRVNEPISKKLFLIALFMPFLTINTILIVSCYFFPQFTHYLTILLAFHIGLSFSDFICLKNILLAPKNSYIEENEEGFEILVFKPYSKGASC